jgi:hypothetical protein
LINLVMIPFVEWIRDSEDAGSVGGDFDDERLGLGWVHECHMTANDHNRLDAL